MGTEHRLDAARADVAKLEKNLALERARCGCRSAEQRAIERELRDAKDILRNMENEAFALMGAK